MIRLIPLWCVLTCLLVLTACGGVAENSDSGEKKQLSTQTDEQNRDEFAEMEHKDDIDEISDINDMATSVESETQVPPATETNQGDASGTQSESKNHSQTAVDATLEEEHVVEIVDFAYSPVEIKIKAGDSIKFINRDAIKHSATADDQSFDTGMLGQDEEKIIHFDKAGDYSYYCIPHPGMKGVVKVNTE